MKAKRTQFTWISNLSIGSIFQMYHNDKYKTFVLLEEVLTLDNLESSCWIVAPLYDRTIGMRFIITDDTQVKTDSENIEF